MFKQARTRIIFYPFRVSPVRASQGGPFHGHISGDFMAATALAGAGQPALKRAALIGALGVVFGDIGTSPLYAYKEALHTAGNVEALRPIILGCISLVFWALIIVVSVKYVLVVMRATNDGEGGIMALTALAATVLKNVRWREAAILCGLVGAALFYGDCIITPAISVLSAVEGLEIATPVFKPYIVPLAASILAGLFFLQGKGTARIGKLFGPIMIVWFAVIGVAACPYSSQPGNSGGRESSLRSQSNYRARLDWFSCSRVGFPGPHRSRGPLRGRGPLHGRHHPHRLVCDRSSRPAS